MALTVHATIMHYLLSTRKKSMTARKILLSLLVIVFVSIACKKDFSDRQCEELKMSMSADNIAEVKNLVTDLISKLPSDDYNQQNVNTLVSSLPGECGMTAQVLCFSCIQTLPEQTEIQVTFTYSGTSYTKIFDISYNMADNKMKMVNMHN